MRRHVTGFTILELLAVLAVMAVLFAIGVPAYQGMIARTELDRAVSLITTEIQSTRSEARKGTLQSVTASAGGTTIVSRGRTLTLPAAKTDGAFTVTFQPPFGTIQTPTGSVTPVTPVSVVVRSTRKSSLFKTISVVSLMGKVVVK